MHPGVEKAGFKLLMYIVIDPRVVAVRKGGSAIITPDDMKGVKFRVPGSKMLQQYYRMVGANPTPVAWAKRQPQLNRVWQMHWIQQSEHC